MLVVKLFFLFLWNRWLQICIYRYCHCWFKSGKLWVQSSHCIPLATHSLITKKIFITYHQIPLASQSLVTYSCYILTPLHPNISVHILHTVLYTSLKVLTMGICVRIKSFLFSDHFLYSCDLNVWFRGDIIRRK